MKKKMFRDPLIESRLRKARQHLAFYFHDSKDQTKKTAVATLGVVKSLLDEVATMWPAGMLDSYIGCNIIKREEAERKNISVG